MDLQLLCADGAGEKRWSLLHLFSLSSFGKFLGMKTVIPQPNFTFFKTEIETLCHK